MDQRKTNAGLSGLEFALTRLNSALPLPIVFVNAISYSSFFFLSCPSLLSLFQIPSYSLLSLVIDISFLAGLLLREGSRHPASITLHKSVGQACLLDQVNWGQVGGRPGSSGS